MSTGNEDWMENWQGSARKSGKRSVWITLALLLPAIALTVGLTRFSTKTIEERNQQIEMLHDSILHITEKSSLPAPLPLPDSADALSKKLYEENARLRDSLTHLNGLLAGLSNPPNNSDEIGRQLELLLGKLQAAEETNRDLCQSLVSTSRFLTRLASTRGVDSAIVNQALSQMAMSRKLCEKLLNQLQSIGTSKPTPMPTPNKSGTIKRPPIQ